MKQRSLTEILMDFYLAYPLVIDGVLIAAGLLINEYAPCIFLIRTTCDTLSNICLSLISTQVSLAGFVLAVLTIIVTVKENITAKQSWADAKNPLEFLFGTQYYPAIIGVLQGAIIELSLSFIIAYLLVILVDCHVKFLIEINTSLVVVTGLSLARCFYILFTTIKLSTIDRTES